MYKSDQRSVKTHIHFYGSPLGDDLSEFAWFMGSQGSSIKGVLRLTYQLKLHHLSSPAITIKGALICTAHRFWSTHTHLFRTLFNKALCWYPAISLSSLISTRYILLLNWYFWAKWWQNCIYFYIYFNIKD